MVSKYIKIIVSSYPNRIQTYQHIISTTYVSLTDSRTRYILIRWSHRSTQDSPRSPAESGTQGSVWNSVRWSSCRLVMSLMFMACWLCFHGNLGVTVSIVNHGEPLQKELIEKKHKEKNIKHPSRSHRRARDSFTDRCQGSSFNFCRWGLAPAGSKSSATSRSPLVPREGKWLTYD